MSLHQQEILQEGNSVEEFRQRHMLLPGDTAELREHRPQTWERETGEDRDGWRQREFLRIFPPCIKSLRRVVHVQFTLWIVFQDDCKIYICILTCVKSFRLVVHVYFTLPGVFQAGSTCALPCVESFRVSLSSSPLFRISCCACKAALWASIRSSAICLVD